MYAAIENLTHGGFDGTWFVISQLTNNATYHGRLDSTFSGKLQILGKLFLMAQRCYQESWGWC